MEVLPAVKNIRSYSEKVDFEDIQTQNVMDQQDHQQQRRSPDQCHLHGQLQHQHPRLFLPQERNGIHHPNLSDLTSHSNLFHSHLHLRLG